MSANNELLGELFVTKSYLMMEMNIKSLRTVTSDSKISWSSLRLKEFFLFFKLLQTAFL